MRDIKYTELVFKLKFIENVTLSKYKILMLNGALLNTLLKFYCINKRDCSSCSIVSKCLIQNLLGNNYEANKPLILQSYNIRPYYLIDCSDEKRKFKENQELTFSIRLINEAIDYLSHFIYVFDQLGIIGLGPNKAKYDLIGIYNNKGNPIFENGMLNENNINIEYISDSISYKKPFIKESATLVLITPFAPNQISFMPYLSISHFIKDRLMNFNAIEEQDMKLLDAFVDDENITSFNLSIVKQNYPIKKLEQKETIYGFKGEINFSQGVNNLMDYLIACEKLCIGSHIIFGYGRFTIKGEGQDARKF